MRKIASALVQGVWQERTIYTKLEGVFKEADRGESVEFI